MTDAFIIIPSITFIAALFIFAYVFGQRRRSAVNSSFLFFVFFMMLVPFLDIVTHLTISQKINEILYKILNSIVLSLGFCFLNFVFTLINKKRNAVYWFVFCAVIISIIIMQIFPIAPIESVQGSIWKIPVPSIWYYPMFFLCILIPTAYAFFVCIVYSKKKQDVVFYKQLRLVILGAVLSTPVCMVTALVGPFLFGDFNYVRFASLSILVNILFMFRAIQRHFFLSVNIEQVENAFNQLFENSHDSVILLDSMGYAVQVNNSAKNLLGVSVSSISHQFLEKNIVGYSFGVDGTDIAGTLKMEQAFRELQISQSLVKADDISLGKLLVIRDITSQKKTEQLIINTKNLESIGQLAGGIAHDFNNFLCGIVSNITLAKMELNPLSRTAELLSLSEKTALEARDLTRQLLTFSKGDSRKIETFDIVELLREICGLLAHGSSVKIEIDLPLMPVYIISDRGQMRQVFHNIVLNGIESMFLGGVLTIQGLFTNQDVSDDSGDKNSALFQVIVTDQGCGIADENLSRIFEPYFTTKSNGNGLGLAIVASIVKKNNGIISVNSHVGKGTAFTITLPVSKADLPSVQTVANDKERLLVPGRILIMDDYRTIRLSLALLLRHMGYTVDQASSGNQAVELYDTTIKNGSCYQAVITDLTVPGAMGGLQLAEELHKRDPDLCIIVSSGYSEEVAISQYRDFGFAGVLHKPYNPQELKDVLGAVLLVN